MPERPHRARDGPSYRPEGLCAWRWQTPWCGARTIGGVEIVIQNKLDDIFVIKKRLYVNDRIVFDGVQQIHDREKVE